ncbi:MAG: hypothetical protein QMB98_07920 [Flaviflexus sp.]|uniref:hypothetical protein n=1 Tax=Flaviflexus sp. TaxID=1969482 RepID=UPI00352F340E
MTASDFASNPEYQATIRQSRSRALLLTAIAILTLAIGYILTSSLGHGLLLAALSAAGWIVVQIAGIAYLRTSPKHPAVGLSITAGIATGLVVLLITHQSVGYQDAIIVAGSWFLCGAVTEIARGRRWAKTMVEQGTTGQIVRTLATFTGYDGTPVVSFLAGGILVGLSAWLLDLLPWATPFAMLVHAAVGLGLSATTKS